VSKDEKTQDGCGYFVRQSGEILQRLIAKLIARLIAKLIADILLRNARQELSKKRVFDPQKGILTYIFEEEEDRGFDENMREI